MVKKGNYVNFKLKARKNERTFHSGSTWCEAYRKGTVEKRPSKKYSYTAIHTFLESFRMT